MVARPASLLVEPIYAGYNSYSTPCSISCSYVLTHRPNGQTRPVDSLPPVFGPCQRLDFELEVAFFVGSEATKLSCPVPIDEAEKHIFGTSD